jgi:hypothetical protein
MKMTVIASALACLWACGADAAVAVKEQIFQSGQFVKKDCTSDPKETDYDECACDADVRYPQLEDMSDRNVQDRLNRWFKDQASKAVCAGDQVASPDKNAPPPAKAHMSLSVHYETSFTSDSVLGFKFTDWAYTGGAHGNGSVIGVVVDLEKGKMLAPSDIFAPRNMNAINQAIYTTLLAKPEEEIFRDQVETRKDTFIKDGQCGGCTLTLTREGVHVLFQTYEVAPYGAGNTDVLIPAKYVSYPVVAQALKEQKLPPSEKK